MRSLLILGPLCIITFFKTPDAVAEVITAEGRFSIVESDAVYGLRLSTGGSFTSRPRVTGFIPATITFDTETQEVTELKIIGTGLLNWDTFSFNIATRVNFDGVGNVAAIINTYFYNLGVEVNAKSSSVRIDPITGALNPSDFQLLANRGEASVGIEVEGQSITETLYYNQNPEIYNLSRAPVLRSEKIRNDLYEREYHFSINLEASDFETTKVDGSNLSITTTEEVKLLAKFIYKEKTGFGRWHEYNRYFYDGDSLDAKSPYGFPMYLAYALGHEHYRANEHRPFRLHDHNGMSYFIVNSQFRRADVEILMSHTLAEDSWTPVPEEWLSSGADSLKKGSRRNLTVRFPIDSDTLFFKVVASPPPATN